MARGFIGFMATSSVFFKSNSSSRSVGSATRGDLVLGIMSGTSLDGVDYALTRVSQNHIELLKLWSVRYPADLKRRLVSAALDRATSYETALLHHDLGRFYAARAPHVRVDYIGLHGQTIFHRSHKTSPATFQIGEPSYLAARFKVPVVCQFRNMDIALGGQGAPLATLFHREVFSHNQLRIAVNNLGGISNVTYLPGRGKHILSFDTGPANLLIDAAVKNITRGRELFDNDGRRGSRGLPDMVLVKKWMKHRYLKIRPPKSTGREEFGEVFFKLAFRDCRSNRLNTDDIVATFTEFTAMTIADSYSRFLPRFPDVVILAGGGARNPNLVERIRARLRKAQWESESRGIHPNDFHPIDVTTSDALGWPAQSIEPAAFALLAYRTMHGKKGNIPETTGAKLSAVLGQIVPAP